MSTSMRTFGQKTTEEEPLSRDQKSESRRRGSEPKKGTEGTHAA